MNHKYKSNIMDNCMLLDFGDEIKKYGKIRQKRERGERSRSEKWN